LKDEKVLEDFNIFHGVMTWMNGDIDIAPETMYAFPLFPTMSLSYNKTLLIQLQYLHFGLYTDSCQHTSSLTA